MESLGKLGRASLLALSTLAFAVTAEAADISGAGATFPYPVYAKWAEAYKQQSGTSMNYQSIGSGGGIKQIGARTVDFGASDKPLTSEELAKADLVQFPTVMGGVVPVVNIPGLKPGELKLTGPVLAKIYLGEIKKWSDPAIAADNKDLKLPDSSIAVVHRSDGSGTTYNFTYYLNAVEPAWGAVGVSTAVEWPAGLGGKGNEGVAAMVGQTKGSIGYVEYAYALQNNLTYTEMQNKDGKFVAPSYEAFQAAAANADWKHAPGFHLILANQPGADSWPMTAATFILVHKTQAKPERAKEVLKFFDWAYEHGGPMAKELDYVPLPESVVKLVKESWKEIVDGSGKPVL
ncbi:MAG TPA: phosphate ABC transporter substrate-binding protein PstS [Parvibaculum sp.]|uniref:phosphate ABC transporter substrate-binding protein PstS n=1 Tax=Parvibaculum sp. TaxID=2024848 RepID=UPI002C8AF947|nr:phosphate ABC transporter substrate-binding protein PstS [Parvibaculum sp.]HMM15747.1 phosphate ABC transporter substrate-binding protein PstS [Parvibaculum sp.]